MNYCSNCGVKLEQHESFCHNCGVKTQKNYQTQNNYYNNNQNTYNGAKPKNKFIAGVLAIILGSMGIHNFYLGYTGKGVAQLLLFVFWLGWVSFLWSIYEAIQIFTGNLSCDVKGVPLSDDI